VTRPVDDALGLATRLRRAGHAVTLVLVATPVGSLKARTGDDPAAEAELLGDAWAMAERTVPGAVLVARLDWTGALLVADAPLAEVDAGIDGLLAALGARAPELDWHVALAPAALDPRGALRDVEDARALCVKQGRGTAVVVVEHPTRTEG
jgi:hypothetical protein